MRSTAIALHALELLGKLEAPETQRLLPAIRSSLKEYESSSSHFLVERSAMTVVEANYYGIATAVRTGYFKERTDLEGWIRFVLELQSDSGGFWGSGEGKEVSVEATVYAMLTIDALKQEDAGMYGKDVKLDSGSLLEYLTLATTHDLHTAAQAHLVAHLAPQFVFYSKNGPKT